MDERFEWLREWPRQWHLIPLGVLLLAYAALELATWWFLAPARERLDTWLLRRTR